MHYNTDIIKQTVNIRELFERYGIEVSAHNTCLCPFHNEKTPSCKIYADSFHCFGCGEHGDVISFIMKLENIPFPAACEKLCQMYGIRAGQDDPIITRTQSRKTELINQYNAACKLVEQYKPKTQEEMPNPAFWAAIYARNKLEDKLNLYF